MRVVTSRMTLLGTVSCLSLLTASGALAQEDAGGEFLGTIELGQSKRDIQTDTPVAVTTVVQDEIDDRQAGTVAELIDSVPGVTLVNGSTPQGSGINIRGFGATSSYGTDQKVLITVDGATTGGEELYRIGNQLFTDPELYRSVSVIRGTAGSFEYGSGIVGGIVQLETKDASDFTGGEPGLKFRQTLSGSSNDEGIVSSSILAWQPTENFELLGNYTYRDAGDYTDGGGNEIENSAFNTPSWLLKGRYTFGAAMDHALTFSLTDTSSAERDVPYDSFATTGGSFGNVDRDIRTRVATLKYAYNPVDNDLIDFTAQLSYSDQQIDSSYVEGSSPIEAFFPGVSGLGDADQRYETTQLTLKNTALFDTGQAQHELRAGVELSRRERLDGYAAPGGTDDRLAFFAVDEIALGNLTLTPAIRYEMQDIEGTLTISDGELDAYDGAFQNEALMGGLSARYEWANGFAVFGSAAYTEVLPPIDDLSDPDRIETTEKSHSYELGFSWLGTDVFGQGDVIKTKLNAYRTHLWDVTSYTYTDDNLQTELLDSVDMEGVEFEASYGNLAGYYIDLNANLISGTETRADGSEGRWRNTPADRVGVTLGRKIDETLDLSWEIVAARGEKNYEGEHVPGWSVHNLRATWKPDRGALDGFELRAGIENLLDREYTTNLSTRPAKGRDFIVTLAKTF